MLFTARKGLGPILPTLLLAMAAAACNLQVNELPVNKLPVVGGIGISPGIHIAPLDSFVLRVDASDPDGDEVFFLWSNGGVGSWAANANRDSVVTWVAPASFASVDSVHFSVSVYDFDQNSALVRRLDLPVTAQFGDLLVRVFDLQGNPAPVRIGVVGSDTTETAVSERLFTDLLWGNQTVFTAESESFYGAVLGGLPLFGGYPDTVYVRADVVDTLDVSVARKSLLVVPGRPGDPAAGLNLILGIQGGIDYCAANGIDTLLVRRLDYFLSGQPVPGGTAALRLDAADLTLRAFPGDGPVWLSAGEGDCDFGFYLEGRSGATRIEGFAMIDAAASGAFLMNSSGTLRETLLRDCGSTGVFLVGDGGDQVSLHDVEISGNEYGLSVSGGSALVDGLLVADSAWYGVWLRDGGSADLRRLTVVGSGIAGILTSSGAGAALERSLIAGNGRGIFHQSTGQLTLACNLLWHNSHGHYGGVAAGAGDIVADPLFCSPELGDWRVDAASPALLAACGPIGAFGDCESQPSPYLGMQP